MTASVLASGKVLVAGGYNSDGALASAEVFDPASGGAGAFVATSAMATARWQHTASVLASGKVFVAGAFGGGGAVASAEVFGGVPGDACSSGGTCLLGFCVDGMCCNTACAASCDRCNLPGKAGTCTVAPLGSPGASPACGSSFACDGVSAACPTSCASDAACAPASYCAPDGTCQARKAQAATCNAQADCKQPGCRQCTSGYCVDGFCCDTPCTGTCQTCGLPALKQDAAKAGTCAPSKDGIDPRSECAPAGVLCGPDGSCNGAGACRLFTPAGISCSPDGLVCDGSGSCAPPAAAKCDGDHTTTGANGTTQDCTPYRCDPNGSCRKECTSVADCVAPSVCDTNQRCVAPDPGSGDTGCTVAGAPGAAYRTFHLAWLSGAFALLAASRRRRGRGNGDQSS